MVRGGPVRRTRDVRVRLTPAEHAAWTAARETTGRRELGAWVRTVVNDLLQATPGRPTPAVDHDHHLVDAYQQLLRAGNNLNQLARWANTEHRYPAERQAAAAYADVRAALAEIRAALRARP
jgi:hypothetical protein